MPFNVSRIPATGALVAALFAAQFALAQANGVRMPEVIERFEAEYPAGTTTDEPIAVVLFVSLDVHGHVTKAEVAQSGGKAFDDAALAAVVHWRFAPALRDGQPVPVRIRVPFTFPVRTEAAPPAPQPNPPLDATGAPSDREVSDATQSRDARAPHERARPSATSQSSNPPSDGSANRAEAATMPNRASSELAMHSNVRALAVGRDDTNQNTNQSTNAKARMQVGVGASASDATEVIVQGHYRAPTRGAGDFHIDVGQLSQVPRKNATEMLQLAPGILLTNEGGEGHAHQVFLRGFDAREGQDIEFTVGGVPINEAGNLHGNGHADANFIIPETVLSLRVLEGPFDPRQGNFGVAGCADYRLGLERRGLTLKSTLGSYGTQRIVGLWGPPGLTRCSFGAAEIYKTDGFGQNRDAQRASAITQYEGKFGETGSYRVTGQAYSANYHSAGVLRDDDYRAGRVGFFDTYDARQGGDSSRYSIAADLEQSIHDTLFREQLYVIRRDLRMRKNYTGFLLDVQEPAQHPHAQRGDGIDLSVDSWTIGSRGSSRVREIIGGLTQELEVGYSARGDFGRGTQLRMQASNAVPYRRDIDVEYALGDVGVYTDANLRLMRWLTLRGGLRGNYFAYTSMISRRFPFRRSRIEAVYRFLGALASRLRSTCCQRVQAASRSTSEVRQSPTCATSSNLMLAPWAISTLTASAM